MCYVGTKTQGQQAVPGANWGELTGRQKAIVAGQGSAVAGFGMPVGPAEIYGLNKVVNPLFRHNVKTIDTNPAYQHQQFKLGGGVMPASQLQGQSAAKVALGDLMAQRRVS